MNLFTLRVGDRGFSFDIRRYGPLQTLSDIFSRLRIDALIDVGANRGQFIKMARRSGFRKDVVAFEPVPREFEELNRRFGAQPGVRIFPQALGNVPGVARIHFSSAKTDLASLHEPSETFSGEWRDANTESAPVEVARLDDLWDKTVGEKNRVFLKVDTQGHDLAVLEGAAARFGRIVAIQTELSLRPLYVGQPRMMDTVEFLRDNGYLLHLLKPVSFSSKTGEMLEIDGIFLKSDSFLESRPK